MRFPAVPIIPKEPYDIIDTDYKNFALVQGAKDKGFVQIYSRVPNPGKAFIKRQKDRLIELGYDPSKLKDTPQDCQEPFNKMMQGMMSGGEMTSMDKMEKAVDKMNAMQAKMQGPLVALEAEVENFVEEAGKNVRSAEKELGQEVIEEELSKDLRRLQKVTAKTARDGAQYNRKAREVEKESAILEKKQAEKEAIEQEIQEETADIEQLSAETVKLGQELDRVKKKLQASISTGVNLSSENSPNISSIPGVVLISIFLGSGIILSALRFRHGVATTSQESLLAVSSY